MLLSASSRLSRSSQSSKYVCWSCQARQKSISSIATDAATTEASDRRDERDTREDGLSTSSTHGEIREHTSYEGSANSITASSAVVESAHKQSRLMKSSALKNISTIEGVDIRLHGVEKKAWPTRWAQLMAQRAANREAVVRQLSWRERKQDRRRHDERPLTELRDRTLPRVGESTFGNRRPQRGILLDGVQRSSDAKPSLLVNGGRRMPSQRRHASTAAKQARSQGESAGQSALNKYPEPPGSLRARLRQWHEEHGEKISQIDFLDTTGASSNLDFADNMYRLPHNTEYLKSKVEEEDDVAVIPDLPDEVDTIVTNNRWFKPGDLVDVDFQVGQNHEIAVFVRYVGSLCQLFTVKGKWLHTSSKNLQFSVSQWISPSEIAKLLPFMPKPEDNDRGMQAIAQAAYMSDLSIPRSISGPLVSRLTQFADNVKQIYRQHAHSLDNAHAILSHDMDIRFSTLKSAATALLKTSYEKLSHEKLCAVYQALVFAGPAFDFDKNSFRQTGYIQIRSKAQVKTAHLVIDWVRQWQADQAAKANLSAPRAQKMALSEGTKIMESFLGKTRDIVRKSRQDRQVLSESVGISKHRFAIAPNSKAVRIQYGNEFNDNDREFIKFIYSWTITRRFGSHPSLSAISSLILQSLNLYPDHALAQKAGMILLEEIGTVLPYENRVRHDSNLQLAVSEYNRPLEILGERTAKLREEPEFVDSMHDLRHDLGDLAAYSIDSASSVELDDAISVEKGESDGHGRDTYWVHVHIANPTAFFSKHSPIAKLARHQGETLYFPEHVYRMLPTWVSESFFSLDAGRPCLTFSARLDDDGRMVETNIRPSTIRNHVALTYDDLDKILGTSVQHSSASTVLTVGGMPPANHDTTKPYTPTPAHIDDFKLLQKVKRMLEKGRRRAGGIFWDNQSASVNVWESEERGLSLEPPYWAGSRRVQGDPVIRVVTQGQRDSFSAGDSGANGIVREMMLLAGEIAGRWCHDRQIPAIYRGIVRTGSDIRPEDFRREHLSSYLDAENGRLPLHLGKSYMRLMGEGALSTTPLSHHILGRTHYCKVTSPLRRYGDMILHWQIEAALREEARRGTSLQDDAPGADRDFLPFPKNILDLVLVGLKPREKLISRAKSRSTDFWIAQLMFRALACGERTDSHVDEHRPAMDGTITMPQLPKSIFLHIDSNPGVVDVMHYVRGGVDLHTSIAWSMEWPQKYGLLAPRAGDIWEVEPAVVNVEDARLCAKPVRLVRRVNEDGWVGYTGTEDELRALRAS